MHVGGHGDMSGYGGRGEHGGSGLTEDGEIICHQYNKPGHITRECINDIAKKNDDKDEKEAVTNTTTLTTKTTKRKPTKKSDNATTTVTGDADDSNDDVNGKKTMTTLAWSTLGKGQQARSLHV